MTSGHQLNTFLVHWWVTGLLNEKKNHTSPSVPILISTKGSCLPFAIASGNSLLVQGGSACEKRAPRRAPCPATRSAGGACTWTPWPLARRLRAHLRRRRRALRSRTVQVHVVQTRAEELQGCHTGGCLTPKLVLRQKLSHTPAPLCSAVVLDAECNSLMEVCALTHGVPITRS